MNRLHTQVINASLFINFMILGILFAVKMPLMLFAGPVAFALYSYFQLNKGTTTKQVFIQNK